MQEEKYVWARQLLMYLLYESGMSYESAGRVVLRHHATALYSRKKILGYIDIYTEIRTTVKKLKAITI